MASYEKKPAINRWAEEDRPREKLAERGSKALTDAELLAILIGSGSSRETAVELMQRLLADCHGNLGTVGNMDVNELCVYNGIGPAKAITILAACELGRRRQEEDNRNRRHVAGADDIFRYFLPGMRNLPAEECHVLLLNRHLDIIGSKCVSRGGIVGTGDDIRLVLREALVARATAIALCHNHPSGNVRPSREDDSLTLRMKKACDTMDITFVDHVVITDTAFYSYNDEGRL